MMKRGHDVESAPGIWRWRSRGTLCRNRRLFGTLERLRCVWAGQDREGGEGCERAGNRMEAPRRVGFQENHISDFGAEAWKLWRRGVVSDQANGRVRRDGRYACAAV